MASVFMFPDDPTASPRVRRMMQLLAALYNSLTGSGAIVEGPTGQWTIPGADPATAANVFAARLYAYRGSPYGQTGY